MRGKCRCGGKNIYGGVVLRVAICVASLIMLGGAIFMVLKTFETNKADDYRIAERLSDEGLHAAFNKLAQSRDWDTDFDGEADDGGGGRFSVAFTREERDGGVFLTITSTGVSGSVTKKTERTLRLTVFEEGDTSWAVGR